MKMKRILSLFLVLIMTFVLFSCQSSESDDEIENSNQTEALQWQIVLSDYRIYVSVDKTELTSDSDVVEVTMIFETTKALDFVGYNVIFGDIAQIRLISTEDENVELYNEFDGVDESRYTTYENFTMGQRYEIVKKFSRDDFHDVFDELKPAGTYKIQVCISESEKQTIWYDADIVVTAN